ncbi:hypothetical protein [Lentimicrobium sp.]|jgi:hypothetical protein|uniref:hypothetical protein n=1 Tax=Lentimicrobium sp. TaxID=2034841 RepID=UPI0025DB3A81|nr:hypothetical protein [Lentimicrobium sp.]MCO5256806.1 hypothetical protein [Lentimicrobium sp.]MCO5263646.1 hypothetical protein [Lentimicrobium sp.]HOP12403.1 hypothetical protein [Lentimicrobium sp.]HPF64425.1 hypothetical protein [Lentimicrobium sp.]HPJ61712.1 hypothetical protein [Lentimicrobium sp.]
MTNDKFSETDNDRFLAQLMANLPLEKAPEGFTSGIMQQIQSGIEPLADTPEYRRQMLWGYLSVLATLVIVVIMLFAQWPFLKINLFSDTDQLRNLLNASLGILEGFNSIVSYLKDSSTMIIIFLSVGLLLLFERLIRNGFQQKRTFLF